ncbi:MAG TPA: FG-GAP-like repeat-containing protein [Thermoanaerobaculia bacterium]|nr:FG-GAP-like repeat-containing protein [Thermoanaerobaculia bacterium]
MAFLIAALALSAPNTLRAACTFGLSSPSSYAANANPGDVATGDFDNDGHVDLAILNRAQSTITIVRGNNSGGFHAPTTIATPYSQGDLLSEYLDDDANLDLVFAVEASPTTQPHLQTLLGNGDGTFTAVAYTAQQLVSQNPDRIALADFDNDGFLDAAVTKSNGKFASLINVSGKFIETAEYTARAAGVTTGVAVGDFDGDGERDVAVSEAISKKVYLYYGHGDGTFTAVAATINVPHAIWVPEDVEAGDFNGDGKDDLAIVMRDPTGSTNYPPLNIALSNGSARTFATPVAYGELHASFEALVRDLDGDGHLDVLVTDAAALRVFRGNGDGTFTASQTYGSRFSAGLAIDDFDHDGGSDVVTTAYTNAAFDLFMNACGRVTLNLTSSANPSIEGSSVTFTATRTPPLGATPTGTITIKRNTTVLNSGTGATVSTTVSDLPAGSHTITAEYSGDARFIATTATLTQVVTATSLSAPTGFNAFSTGGSAQLSWTATPNADHYEVWRNTGSGWAFLSQTSVPTYTDATAPASSAILYRARAVAAGGSTSPDSAQDATSTYSFTDATLQAGVTRVKLAHLTELRTAANALRVLAGLTPVSWAEPSPQRIRASHITELRTAVNEARTALAIGAFSFTDPTLTAGSTPVRAVHFEELRAAIR